VGIVVGAALIAVETLLILGLKAAHPMQAFGIIYLVGVLLISAVWGWQLAVAMSIASALAYSYCLHWPDVGVAQWTLQDAVVVAVFLAVALCANLTSGLARARAVAADQHRSEARANSDRADALAEQQAALRRVATLVARGAMPQEVFSAVADELASVFHVVNAGLLRYEPDGTGVIAAFRYEPGVTGMPVTGDGIPLDGDLVGALVQRTGRAVRIDNHDSVGGPQAARIRASGIKALVGVPVVVEGQLWGSAIIGSTSPHPMAPDTEARLSDFADLLATAIANADAHAALQASRDELAALAEQQAALRRVATLVAQSSSPTDVFAAIADGIADGLRAANASVNRFDGQEVEVLALSHLDANMTGKPSIGERHTLEGDNIATRVRDTARPARLDLDALTAAPGSIAARLREMGLHTTIGTPIVVNGAVWGMAAMGSSGTEPLSAEAEARIADFADLAATAIANADARAQLQASRDNLALLAAQQSALRRLATLVATGVGPSEVFSAVANEMARCLNVGHAAVYQYDSEDAVVPLAVYHDGAEALPTGLRIRLRTGSVEAKVLACHGTARLDRDDDTPPPHCGRMRGLGLYSEVGVPIMVDSHVWGVAVVGSLRPEPLPLDTEQRVSDFADLLATATVAATTRAELIASRARIVAAADNARRRIERDLHDGAQQRLVSLGLQLRLAESGIPAELPEQKQQLSEIGSGMADVLTDLQEIARGIHPAIVSRGGLAPALKTLARRATLPVQLDVAVDRRFPDHVEVGIYYVVAEALTNTAKHAQASEVCVSAHSDETGLHVLVRDDGIGGADSRKGSGLLGLKDRVEALGGSIDVVSPPGEGTTLRITIPTGEVVT
jgi:signal transduction histidine kinase